MVINEILGNKQEKNNFYFFHFYLYIAIIIFMCQKYALPTYLGLSGPEGGIGTDDVRFYAKLVDGDVPYAIQFNIYGAPHPFTIFLGVLYPFHIYTPLNLVIVNILGITFLPYYTYMLTRLITSDDRVANLSQKLILFCPYSMEMGLIIMRDIWITTFTVSGIYYFISKKYWHVAFIGILIIFIRLGSFAFFTIGILVFIKRVIYSYVHNQKQSKLIMTLLFILAIISVYFLLPYITVISEGKSEGLFRSNFATYLSSVNEDGTLLKLMYLPVWLRTPALTLFFYFCPFLELDIMSNGVFHIRGFLGTMSPVYMIFLWKGVFNTCLNIFFNKSFQSKISSIVYLSILFALCLGTISLQVRHKTVLFPFLYILAAYGWYIPTKRFNSLSNILLIAVVAFQIFFLIIFK
jgi:hypothetical protein